MIRTASDVDVGIAVATDRGLVVPVIRRVRDRRLPEVAQERERLVKAARAGKLSAEEMSGATVTLSNLGGFGVDRFTAMINPGEAAILAVGRIVERVLPRERGLVVVPTLTLTLTLDHRVVDGAGGGAALAELAALLEGEMAWNV
jgi:pyruvate dehydrogenase E2 component (dihydrolipoamide acetyltransferase)